MRHCEVLSGPNSGKWGVATKNGQCLADWGPIQCTTEAIDGSAKCAFHPRLPMCTVNVGEFEGMAGETAINGACVGEWGEFSCPQEIRLFRGPVDCTYFAP